jgi:formate dehydrogenase iron-sulfur subunit
VTLVDDFIAKQQALTAVELFSQHHDAGEMQLGTGAYRALLPATPPGPGEQYGFEVDLDSCTGCKACVTACHSLNGLDDDESWRHVGVLHGVENVAPFQQTVTAACHHCVDPACLAGCPVDAYEKDPFTGIVSHLDDQCIGCRYCSLTCPYEIPRFSPSRGIVRKCDMCAGRLAAGEPPACVQACPNGAITVTIAAVSDLRARAATGSLVAGAPESSITVPSTRYRTTRLDSHAVLAADHAVVRRAAAHMPLAVMLVLTQVSVGSFLAVLAIRARGGAAASSLSELRGVLTAVPLAAGLVALAASVLHLGRPKLAWRAVIGWRHSWVSREVVAFGTFAMLAAANTVLRVVGHPSPQNDVLDWMVGLAGVAGVVCSAFIYSATRRTWWAARFTVPRFALTVIAGGMSTVLATALVGATLGGHAPGSVLVAVVRPVGPLLAATVLAGLAWDASVLRFQRRGLDHELGRTATLLFGELRTALVWRVALGAIGGAAVPLALVSLSYADGPNTILAGLLSMTGLVAVVAGELVERWLFFTAVAPPRMPGGLR